MKWIKLTDNLGNKVCINVESIEEIKEKIYNDGEKSTQILFSNDKIEIVKEKYDFVLSQLGIG